MKDFIKIAVLVIFGIVVGILVMKQCQDDPSIAIRKMLMEHQQEVLDSLSMLKKQVILSADSIAIQRQTTIINKYNYVYETIDSIIYADSNNVNRVLRAWADSIRQVLKQITDNIGTGIYWEITPDSISAE